MRKLYLIFLCSFLYLSSTAQWTWQNPKPVGNNINGVHAFSTTEVVAVADGSTIMRTIDGGTTWQYIYPFGDPSTSLTSVSFVGTTGYTVGFFGSIAKSSNSGSSWSIQSTPGQESYKDVFTISANHAVAVGLSGAIARTTNGADWNLCNITGAVKDYNSVSFKDASNGIAVGVSGAIARTTNGGQDWTVLASFTTVGLNGIYYKPTSSEAWAVGGSGQIWYSSDDGSNWTQLTVVNATDNYFHVSIIGGRGYITGINGSTAKILRSIDNGVNNNQTWSNYASFAGMNNFLDASFTQVDKGYVVGQQGAVLNTSDGVTFNLLTTGYSLSQHLRAIDMFDLNRGIAAGNLGSIKYTTNGSTWQTAVDPIGNSTFRGVAFGDASNAWIVGHGSRIIYSNNGGANWTAQTSPVTHDLYAVDFTSATTGIATGASGKIIKTTDGGSNWNEIVVPGLNSSMLSVNFPTAMNGWAAGTGGRIIRTQDGGNTWTIQTSGTTETLNTISFVPNTTIGYAGGTNGILLKTTDGVNWVAHPNNPFGGQEIRGVMAGNENSVAIFYQREMYHTIDNGVTWQTEAIHVGTGVMGAFDLVNGTNGWIVGDHGRILKSQAGTVLLPIDLVSFTAQTADDKVILKWETSNEINNKGFEILRHSTDGKADVIGFIASKGEGSVIRSYGFVDRPAGGNTFWYQLRQTDKDGKQTLSNKLRIKLDISRLTLAAYPNPAGNTATLTYSLPADTRLSIILRDQLGNPVRTLVAGQMKMGNYAQQLDLTHIPSGQYYIEMNTSGKKRLIKLSLQR